MKGRIAFDGLEDFTTVERFLIRVYLVYLFIVPVVSVLSYEVFVEESSFRHTAHGAWQLAFGFVIVIQLGLTVNNLRVGKSIFSLVMLFLRTPLEVAVLAFIFEWDIWYALTIVYALEVLGLIIGLCVGVIFRKAEITLQHRILSGVIALFFLLAVYYRFHVVLDLYLHFTDNSIYMWLIAIACVIPVSIPYIQLFVKGEDGKNLNMGNSTLMESLTGVFAVAALFYIVALPILSGLFAEWM